MRVIGNSSVFYADINSSNLLSCVRVLIKLLLLRSKQNNVVPYLQFPVLFTLIIITCCCEEEMVKVTSQFQQG